MGLEMTIAVLAVGALIMFWSSQRKFKDKVYCIMHTQQGIRLELWLPLWQRHVKYGNRKKGDEGIYYINPAYFTNTLWDKGINKFFPAQVKTIEFMWYSPLPINFMAERRWDPERQEELPAISWHTPEVRNAAWNERGYRSFQEASAIVGGTGPAKSGLNTIQKIVMLASFGGVIILGYLMWTNGLI